MPVLLYYFQMDIRLQLLLDQFQKNDIRVLFLDQYVYFQTKFRPIPYVYFQMCVLFLDQYAFIFRLIFRRAVLYMTFRFGSVVIRSKKSLGFGWIIELNSLLYKCKKKLKEYVTKCNISKFCNCIHNCTGCSDTKRFKRSCQTKEKYLIARRVSLSSRNDP